MNICWGAGVFSWIMMVFGVWGSIAQCHGLSSPDMVAMSKHAIWMCQCLQFGSSQHVSSSRV